MERSGLEVSVLLRHGAAVCLLGLSLSSLVSACGDEEGEPEAVSVYVADASLMDAQPPPEDAAMQPAHDASHAADAQPLHEMGPVEDASPPLPDLSEAPDAEPASQGMRYTHLPDHATTLGQVADRYLARFDFDGDGLDDLLLGGANNNRLGEDRIVLMLSLGDGRFREATEAYIAGDVRAAAPLGAVADFNSDGVPDVAVFDAGESESGQRPEGGYEGGVPHLLLSVDGQRQWRASAALRRAIVEADPDHCWPQCTEALHLKAVTAGDIDGDGDVDLYVESGGGYDNPAPHFLIHEGLDEAGAPRFRVDASEARRDHALIWGESGYWRYATHQLVDMDADGDLDLVMGQLRRIHNGQDALASRVAYNDGAGRFSLARSVALPYARWNEGWTYVKAIAPVDLDADGDVDLVLAHERGNVIPDPEGVGNTGRYLQILLRDGEGFEDVTDAWLGAQPDTTASAVEPYGANHNLPHLMEWVDVDGDGLRDVFMGEAGPVGSHAPMLYLGLAEGGFEAQPPSMFTSGDWFGEQARLIDLDGDGGLDVVHIDLLPGADGVYGTGDEVSQIIPTFITR